MPAVDPYDFESDWLNDERNLKAAAEIHATIIQANLQEYILEAVMNLLRSGLLMRKTATDGEPS